MAKKSKTKRPGNSSRPNGKYLGRLDSTLVDTLSKIGVLDDFGVAMSQNPPTNVPANWLPSYYVLCTASMAEEDDTGDYTFSYNLKYSGIYSVKDLNANYQEIADIDKFAVAVRDGVLQASSYTPYDIGALPLEFRIKQNCIIIVALDNINWQFRRQGPAVTVRLNPNDTTYGNIPPYFGLHQLSASASKAVAVPDPPAGNIFKIGPGCAVVYFSAYVKPMANDPTEVQAHPFNLHVQFIQGTQTVDLKIDPDIKNDGTNPQWPP